MNKTINRAVKAPVITKSTQPEPEKRRSSIRKMVQISQWLSLDVALGAACSSTMVCRLMNVSPIPWMQLLILGGVVMLIYTLDHLWDVHHMPVIPITARHAFHWQFKQELSYFAAVLFLVLCVASVVALPVEVFYFGCVLGSLVAAYLWIVNHLPQHKVSQWFHKEICIALMYTAGIWGSVWIQTDAVQTIYWLLAVLFGIIALLNLLLFSCYELEEDIIQSQRSVARSWGKDRVSTCCSVLFVLFAVIALVLCYYTQQVMVRHIVYIECMMAGVLLLLFSFPDFFRKKYRYRWIGDGIFLLPALALF